MLDEPFTIFLAAQGVNIRAPEPDLSAFTLLSPPTTRATLELNRDTGRYERRFAYSYQLLPRAPGLFVIDALSIESEGKTYTTDPITVRVREKDPDAALSFYDPKGTQPLPIVFVETVVSKRTVYVGEPVYVEDAVWTRYPRTAPQSKAKDGGAEGFWSEEIRITANAVTKERGDFVYETWPILRRVYFPLTAGQKTIGANEYIVDVMNRLEEVERLRLSAQAAKITVRALPDEGRPAEFSGAVGAFSFSARVNITTVETYSPITLTLEAKGDGNAKGMQMPDVRAAIPKHADIYESKTFERNDCSGGRIRGTKRVEYLVIPKRKGAFVIAPITFSYFSPSENAYRATESAQIVITALQGEEPSETLTARADSLNALSIRHIAGDTKRLSKRGSFIFFYSFPYVYLFLLLITLGAVIVVKRESLGTKGFFAKGRAKNEAKAAFERARANRANGENDGYYSEIEKGLSRYLTLRLHLPRSASKETICSLLSVKEIPKRTLKKLEDVFEALEYARYTPAKNERAPLALIKKAEELITAFEERL